MPGTGARLEDCSVVTVHANLASTKVQPGSQKRTGLAGEEASGSALGDPVLPRPRRDRGVVVIVTVCGNYPSLEQVVAFQKD